jgi:hypothetical protein
MDTFLVERTIPRLFKAAASRLAMPCAGFVDTPRAALKSGDALRRDESGSNA